MVNLLFWFLFNRLMVLVWYWWQWCIIVMLLVQVFCRFWSIFGVGFGCFMMLQQVLCLVLVISGMMLCRKVFLVLMIFEIFFRCLLLMLGISIELIFIRMFWLVSICRLSCCCLIRIFVFLMLKMCLFFQNIYGQILVLIFGLMQLMVIVMWLMLCWVIWLMYWGRLRLLVDMQSLMFGVCLESCLKVLKVWVGLVKGLLGLVMLRIVICGILVVMVRILLIVCFGVSSLEMMFGWDLLEQLYLWLQ